MPQLRQTAPRARERRSAPGAARAAPCARQSEHQIQREWGGGGVAEGSPTLKPSAVTTIARNEPIAKSITVIASQPVQHRQSQSSHSLRRSQGSGKTGVGVVMGAPKEGGGVAETLESCLVSGLDLREGAEIIRAIDLDGISEPEFVSVVRPCVVLDVEDL